MMDLIKPPSTARLQGVQLIQKYLSISAFALTIKLHHRVDSFNPLHFKTFKCQIIEKTTLKSCNVS